MLETDGIIVMTVTGNFDIDVIILIAKNAKPKTSLFGVTKRMFYPSRSASTVLLI